MQFKTVVQGRQGNGEAVTLEKVRPSFVNLDTSWHEQRNKEKATVQAKLEADVKPEENSIGNKQNTTSSHNSTVTSPEGKQTVQDTVARPNSTKEVDATKEDVKTDHKENQEPEAPTTVPPVTYSRKGWLMPYEEP